MEPTFIRNIGILSESEQEQLLEKTVAVAGCGGDGGMVAEALARIGIGGLIIADPDSFEVINVNRQFASSMKTIGKKKVDAIGNYLIDINPHLKLQKYEEGVLMDNIEQFVGNTDIVVDEMDIDLPDLSIALQAEASKQGKFVMMGLSVGFGARLIVFHPRGISLSRFLNGRVDRKNFIKRLVPNIPKYIHPSVIENVVRNDQPPPSTSIGVHLVASFVATAVLTLLLGRDNPPFAPRIISVDLMDRQMKVL